MTQLIQGLRTLSFARQYWTESLRTLLQQLERSYTLHGLAMIPFKLSRLKDVGDAQRICSCLQKPTTNESQIRLAGTAILVDLLRRSGQMDDARKTIVERRAGIEEDTIVRVLDFQKMLIDKGDTSCHTIAEAFIGDE